MTEHASGNAGDRPTMLTRREITVATLAFVSTVEANASVAMAQGTSNRMLPGRASRKLVHGENAMLNERITIATQDGDCPTYVLRPSTGDKLAAVILYMDAGGIRPAALEMAQHLAEGGYIVLLPDPFYRFGPYGPLVPKDVFAGDAMAILGPLMATTDNAKAAADTAAYLAYLDTRTDVASKVGAVGFCMGGGMAISSAATYPDRLAAVASFHGGNLATDAATSPHLLVSKLKAEVYVAAAENDDSYPPDMAARLETALRDGGVRYKAETYKGAAHGWMVPDFPVFNPAAADRGWSELLALFERNLRSAG